MDISVFLTNEFLENYVDNPIVINGVTDKYVIEIHVKEVEKC